MKNVAIKQLNYFCFMVYTLSPGIQKSCQQKCTVFVSPVISKRMPQKFFGEQNKTEIFIYDVSIS